MSSKTFGATGEVKSWKKLNEERKAFTKERKQQKLLQSLEVANKLKEQAKQQQAEVAKPPKPAPSTVSIAVPGSILENAQSAELRAYVAGQVARAAAIFRVNEIIIFDDICIATPRDQVRLNEPGEEDDDDNEKARIVRRSSMQLARILQYLECPQYLRKFFFPMHKDLQYSGLLNPLDTPHHLRQQSVFRYREGVITEKAAKPGHSYANVGLFNDVMVDKPLAQGLRVTVRLENPNENSKKLHGVIVSPEEPRRETGVYWGYNVRIASCLSDIFTESPYKGGYDLTIGTSDRGKNVQNLEQHGLDYNHLLIVFGGLRGLETALTNDDKLHEEDPSLLFDQYINVLPNQGSRTIRTEEALLIALTALQEKLNAKVPEIEAELIDEVLPTSTDTSNIMPRFTAPLNKKRKKSTSIRKNYDNNEKELPPRKTKNPFNKTKREGNINNMDDTANPFSTNKDEKIFNSFNSKFDQPSSFNGEKTRNPFNNKKERKSNFERGENTQRPRDNYKTESVRTDDDFEIVSSNTNTRNDNMNKLDLSRFD